MYFIFIHCEVDFSKPLLLQYCFVSFCFIFHEQLPQSSLCPLMYTQQQCRCCFGNRLTKQYQFFPFVWNWSKWGREAQPTSHTRISCSSEHTNPLVFPWARVSRCCQQLYSVRQGLVAPSAKGCRSRQQCWSDAHGLLCYEVSAKTGCYKVLFLAALQCYRAFSLHNSCSLCDAFLQRVLHAGRAETQAVVDGICSSDAASLLRVVAQFQLPRGPLFPRHCCTRSSNCHLPWPLRKLS